MVFELIWTTRVESLEKGALTAVASSPDLDSAKRDLLQNIARKNILRCVERGASNPEYFLHLPLVLTGQSFHLLERGGVIVSNESGTDSGTQHRVWYSHQRLMGNTRAISAGPARVLRERSLWQPLTPDHANTISRKPINVPPLAPMVAANWGKIAGDPGWAGLPLEAYNRQQPCRLKVAGTLTADRVLDLLVESQSLLEAIMRWKIPISYQAWVPAKYAGNAWLIGHSLRELTAGANSSDNEFTIDLTQALGEANNPFVENAREGNWVRWQQLHPDATKNNEAVVNKAVSTTGEADDAIDYRLGPVLQPPAESNENSQAKSRFLRKLGGSDESREQTGWSLSRKLTLGSVGLILLTILGFWFYRSRASQNAQIESISTGNSANADSESGDETGESTTPKDPFDLMLSNLVQRLPSVSLPEKTTNDAVPLLEMAGNREEVRKLEFGLALPKAFLNLSFFPGPENKDLVRNLKSNLGEGEATDAEAEVRLRRIESKKGDETQLLWRWISQPPSGTETTWKMGALVAGQKGNENKYFLPLEGPKRDASKTFLSLIRKPYEIPVSHPAISKPDGEEAKSPWLIDSLESIAAKAKESASSEIKWVRSPSRLENHEYSFIPDREKLASKILNRLKAKPSSRAEQAIRDELQNYPNFGFCLTASTIPGEAAEGSEPTQLKIVPGIIIPRPRSAGEERTGNIVPEKIAAELSDESLRQQIIKALKQLNSRDYALSKADIERLGDWLNSSTTVTPDPDDCRLFTRYLIADELENAIYRVLDSRLRVRVLRQTELQTKNGSQIFPIPAFLFE